MYGLIYCAQNIINKKRYIGQTTSSLKRRINQHKQDAFREKTRMHFHRAIKKHGMNNFIWIILSYASDKKALDKAEIYWIKYYYTMETGYNHKTGGKGGKHSEATKKKLSLAKKGIPNTWQKGKRLSEETKKKISVIAKERQWFLGKHHSEETKCKMRKARALQTITEESKKKMSKSHKGQISGMKGKHHSEENKRKMSEARKKLCADPEFRKKISEACMNRDFIGAGNPMYGKTHSEETKELMSTIAKKYNTNSEVIERKSIATKKAWENKETRERMVKARWGN